MFRDRHDFEFKPNGSLPPDTFSALNDSVVRAYKAGHHPRRIPAELFAGSLIAHDQQLADTLKPFHITPDLFFPMVPKLPPWTVDFPSQWLAKTLIHSGQGSADLVVPAAVFEMMLRNPESGVGAIIQLRSSIGHIDPDMPAYTEEHVVSAIATLRERQIEERLVRRAFQPNMVQSSQGVIPEKVRKFLGFFNRTTSSREPAAAA